MQPDVPLSVAPEKLDKLAKGNATTTETLRAKATSEHLPPKSETQQ